jgi:hypothetical protein
VPPEHQLCPACHYRDEPELARELEYYQGLVLAILRRRGRSLEAPPEMIWEPAVFAIAIGTKGGKVDKVPVEGWVDEQGLWGVHVPPPEGAGDEVTYVVTHLPTGRALTGFGAGKRPSQRTMTRAFFAAHAFCVVISDLTDWRRSEIVPDPALGRQLNEIAEWLTGGKPVLH